jgi:hypothetical protein
VVDLKAQMGSKLLIRLPSGTGKTTVARKMSELYYQMGILMTNDYVDCSASDLIGQYVGHTGPKTQAKLTEALGKVLFVDEAYRFCDGGFSKEAVNELVDSLTRPKFMGKIVVILAGYTDDIDNLLRMNPGLSSRFPEEVIFSNMAVQECLMLLEREIRKYGIDVVPAIKETAPAQYQRMYDMFTELSRLPSWGNGRDVKNLAKSISSAAFGNSAPSSTALAVRTIDILRELEAMLKAQTARCVDARGSPSSIPGHSDLQSPLLTQDPPNPIKTATSTITKSKQADPAPTVEEENVSKETSEEATPDSPPQRDPGVPNDLWQRLQANIAAARSAQKAEQESLAAQEQELRAQQTSEESRLAEIRRLEEELLQHQEDQKRQEELQRQYDDERRRALAAMRARREAEERLCRAREEEERKKRQEEAIQKKLRDLGVCPAGFRWIRDSNGYYCRGGSHFMSLAQLGVC